MNEVVRMLNLGALLGVLSVYADLPVANPTLHFDASAALTITTNESGYVTEWRSATAGLSAATAPVTTSAKFENDIPFVTAEEGRQAVVFGLDKSGNDAGALMDIVTDANQLKTVFIVSRQYQAAAKGLGNLWGDASSQGGAISRTANEDCIWGSTLVGTWTYWVNGIATNSFAECGGTEKPHVMAVKTDAFASKGWVKYLGGAYIQNSSGDRRINNYFKGSLHEVVAYAETLTDEQILSTQRYLMLKWGIGGLYSWTGAKDSNWNDAANWLAGAVPDADATAIYLNGGNVMSATTVTCGGTIDLGGGMLTVAGLTGCTVTDTAATAGTLTINAETEAALGASVSGNVNLVKNGAGVLKVTAAQTYAGTTTLNGGTLMAVQPLTFDFSKYSGMVFHLDAKDVDSIETYAGTMNISKWKSVNDEGEIFYPIKKLYADSYTFAHGNILLTQDDQGRPCARFGSQLDDATSLGSVLCPSEDGTTLKGANVQTVFIVNRQHLAAVTSQPGLFGQVGTSSDRVYRDNAQEYAWSGNNIYRYYTSAKADCAEFGSSSGVAGPHVLAVIRSNNSGEAAARAFTAIGGAYLGKTSPVAKYLCGRFDLYEAIGFSGLLTDEQIQEISEYLIAKWGVKTRDDVVVERPATPLSPNTAYSVKSATTLDFGWMNPVFGNLSFSAVGNAYPLLSFAGALSAVDVSGKTLTFATQPAGLLSRGPILCGKSGIANAFAEVVNGRVTYEGEGVGRYVKALGLPAGLILMLK